MTITTTSTVVADRRQPGRAEYVVLLSMTMALAALGIDMLLPAFDQMRGSFGLAADSPEIARTITAYFLGMAGAQLFFGPLSDRYGRRPVIFAGIVIYVAGAIGSALAPTLSLLLISRFVWGVGAAAGRVVVTAIVRDTFVGDDMAKMMSTLMAVFLLVPILAPSLGALVVAVAPWRAVFWLAAAIAVGLGVWTMVRLPESLPVERRTPIRIDVLRRSAHRVFTEPATLIPMLGVTMLTAVFTSYLASSELLISEVFDRRSQFPIIFGATGIVFGLASLLNRRLVGQFGVRRLLVPVSVTYLTSALVLMALAIGSDGRPRFWVFYPIMSLLFGASLILNPNLNTMALVPLGDIAGTASSIIGAVSLAAGAVVGALIDRQFDGSITPFTVAMVVSAITVGALVLRLPPVDPEEVL